MKNIGYYTLHKEQMNNNFLNLDLDIGQNLLLPLKHLYHELKKKGINFETVDCLKAKGITPDLILFADVPIKSKLVIKNMDLKRRIKSYLQLIKDNEFDWLKYAYKKRIPCLLRIYEPPVVWRDNFIEKNYNYFTKIFTWNTEQIVDSKFVYTPYSQVKDLDSYNGSFSKKSGEFVLMNSNKNSSVPGELYSLRRKVIEWFEGKDGFDLFGFGWKEYKNYKGISENKLKTLSNYKFCFCFENFENNNGYVTEKIFDCLFSGVIPIYYGCHNIDAIVPKGCYIDYGAFNSIDEVVSFCNNMSESDYNRYIKCALEFIGSELYEKVDYRNNVKRIISTIESLLK